MKRQNLTDALLAELGLIDPIEQAQQAQAASPAQHEGTPADPVHEAQARSRTVPPPAHPLADE
jgi:hypothetical protein